MEMKVEGVQSSLSSEVRVFNKANVATNRLTLMGEPNDKTPYYRYICDMHRYIDRTEERLEYLTRV